MLGIAPEGKEFVINESGKVWTARNLKELLSIVSVISDETFREFQSRNDFANWIASVLGFEDLSKAVKDCSSKQCLQARIQEFLSQNKNEVPEADNDGLKKQVETISSRVEEEFNVKTFQQDNSEALDKISSLKSKVLDLETKISDFRKKGFDMYLSWNLLRFAKIKLHVAEKTLLEYDIKRVESLLLDVEKALEEEASQESKIEKPLTLEDIERIARRAVEELSKPKRELEEKQGKKVVKEGDKSLGKGLSVEENNKEDNKEEVG
ncbi:hypothetical protein J7L02_03850 [Candidatus Woesearchaeota archaeon]|nr:hypothetical protein [Candidatus Woesearchaeota archaeon]